MPPPSHDADGARAVAAAHLAALQRRSAQRSPAVQRALQPRLRAAAARAAAPASATSTTSTTSTTHASSAAGTPGPLAQLLHRLDPRLDGAAGVHGGADGHRLPAGSRPLHELKALRDAGPAWARLRVQQRLQQSLAQAPGQAGPLNSHGLALRTLQALQALSPGYLLHFMAQMDSLFALEQRQAQGVRAAAPGKPVRRAGRP